jgi:hypothetical protein
VRRKSVLTAVIAAAIAVAMMLILLPAGSLEQSATGETVPSNTFAFVGPTVSVPCGASIQAAIDASHSGDTILLAHCTYSPSGGLTVDKSVTISGAGVGKTIILGPAGIGPDAFGNPWTIEIGNAATVTLSGFTLVVALQCIIFTSGGLPYAGGGVGIGGSANLNLESVAITTTGQPEGALCPGGEVSYGTGVGFGIDYLTGSPQPHKLVGTGTISGVSISGFGFGGPGVSIGGQEDSPAGSFALISNSKIFTSADDMIGNPAISVGFGGNASTAAIVRDILSSQLSPECTVFECAVIDVESGSSASVDWDSITGMSAGQTILVGSGSTASIADNSIQTGPSGFGIDIDGSTATIVQNSIVAAEFGWGIVTFSSTATITSNLITGIYGTTSDAGIAMFSSSATIMFNSIGIFECEFDPPVTGPSCGPEGSQLADFGILDLGDAGLGTTIEKNVVFETDVGIQLAESFGPCVGCEVKNNTLLDNVDYGLAAYDGDYSFGPNLVVGGLYGVGAVAVNSDTTVTLSQVAIISPSVGPFYVESDNGYVATIVGT